MRPFSRLLRLSAFTLAFALTSSAYYPFVHYSSRTAPFSPMPEKFDLTALPGGTLLYLVSEKGPTALGPQDSFASVLSQIRLAAGAWNSVPSSNLRLAFGGLFTPSAAAPATPRVEVLFDELPPGLLAMGGPMARANAQTDASSPFVPITRSVLILSQDLSQWSSSTESFFTTTLHELGHALGLQHTFTSSAMSTMVTRASTRSKPLAEDDVVGLSLLYPTGDFTRQYGSITGRVVLGDQGAALASVVAIAPGRGAVSALTNPDGTYRIDGILPGQYYIYVHPLPPSAQANLGPGEIVLPLDAANQPFPASDPFDTVFFPGVKDPAQAVQANITAGKSVDGVNFSVQPAPDAGIYGVSTFSYPVQVPVEPAYLNPENPLRSYFVATAYNQGLTASGAPVAGLAVSVLGAPAAVTGLKAYVYAPSYLEADISQAGLDAGPKHLLFALNNRLYVLPSGFMTAATAPPSIGTVTPAFDGTGRRVVNITGANLRTDTRFYFDGLLGTQVGDPANPVVTVVPPVGSNGHVAAVIAVNADGQSSLFAQTPPTFTYDPVPPQSLTTSLVSVAAGSEAMIEIFGVNTNFADGVTQPAFGTSDITVKRIQVVSPTLLRAQIAIAATATPGPVAVSVLTGFELVSLPSGLSVLPAESGTGFLKSEPQNQVPGYTGVFPGSTGVLELSVPAMRTYAFVSVNGVAVPAGILAADKIVFTIPNTVKSGPAVVQVGTWGAHFSALIDIAYPPPVVAARWTGPIPIDAAHPVNPGDSLTVLFGSVPEAVASRTAVLRIGDVVVPASRPITDSAWPGYYFAIFAIPPDVAAGDQVSFALMLNGNASLPFLLPIGAPPAAPAPAN